VEFAEQLRGAGFACRVGGASGSDSFSPDHHDIAGVYSGCCTAGVGHGSGGNGRHSVGTTVFGGMIMSTVLNLFFIPVLYLIIEAGGNTGRKRCSLLDPMLARRPPEANFIGQGFCFFSALFFLNLLCCPGRRAFFCLSFRLAPHLASIRANNSATAFGRAAMARAGSSSS